MPRSSNRLPSQLRTGFTTVRNFVFTSDELAVEERSTSALPAASAVVEAVAVRTTTRSPGRRGDRAPRRLRPRASSIPPPAARTDGAGSAGRSPWPGPGADHDSGPPLRRRSRRGPCARRTAARGQGDGPGVLGRRVVREVVDDELVVDPQADPVVAGRVERVGPRDLRPHLAVPPDAEGVGADPRDRRPRAPVEVHGGIEARHLGPGEVLVVVVRPQQAEPRRARRYRKVAV